MNTTEDKIIAALKHLDSESDEAETLSGVLADMLRAQSFYLRAFPFIGMVAFLGLGVFAVIRFLAAQDVQSWVGYATLFLTALIAMSLIKLWLYLVWVRNSLMREIKRIELRSIVEGRRVNT
jgi:hypothetical protein